MHKKLEANFPEIIGRPIFLWGLLRLRSSQGDGGLASRVDRYKAAKWPVNGGCFQKGREVGGFFKYILKKHLLYPVRFKWYINGLALLSKNSK